MIPKSTIAKTGVDHRRRRSLYLILPVWLMTLSVVALPALPPMPEISNPLPEKSVPIGALSNSSEVELNLPIAPGPFQPTWASIEKNYPGTPDWLRQAKFGIWVHFGPQASGESGDWYARKMYVPGTSAYNNHLKKYGPPAESGYKEVLRDWNPVKLDPAKLTEIYKDAGARFLMIQRPPCSARWNASG